MSLASIVIVGGGQAGQQVAASLRRLGYQGRVTLVCEELHLPYQRPPLSKAYLSGEFDERRLTFKKADWYEKQGIEVVHQAAVSMDRANQTVKLAGGLELDYEHLVLATGARNRRLSVPGADLENVVDLRTRDDAEALAVSLPAAKNVVIVGAGFIGLEVAASVRKMGAAVHVLELADRVMERALSPEASAYFSRAHAQAGIEIHTGTGITGIEGREGRVAEVVTSTGERLSADLVLVGIGAVPNAELAEEAGLEVDGGVVVDEMLRTSDPAVSAIGDVAVVSVCASGARVRLESVQNANDQGRFLAESLTGAQGSYAKVPWFWSDQGTHKLQIAGVRDGCEETVLLPAHGPEEFIALHFAAGWLRCVETVNRAGEHMAARRGLEAGVMPGAEEVRASGFDLGEWVRTRVHRG
ncbi:FAD-dependent oxidoreductase [Brevibacterium sp. R8603A2]|uniref:NAD(P)/FAD-dependent oxidoreductase n=1 Tax=Brevibacterium sp. R8603A2 TaxID=2929779 RepID=UPI000DAF7F00|nr:FAD-dependent oxidoreductase [Brevibacterium sp. R8603A2]MCK1804265.1 FAD-dependent oxidoreductase [Brevibacterium sp. R8603A2]PZO61194.1 MAG: pyridine nucleotide-disulfide oxidoreductase [Pseudoxanthomonas suwonensis]